MKKQIIAVRLLTNVILALILTILIAISGCNSKPSATDGAQCLADKFYPDAVRTIDVNKIDGVDGENAGSQTYKIYFSCELEFTKDYEEIYQGTLFETFKKGQISKIKNGWSTFVRTDNGWSCVGSDYKVDLTQ